MICAIFLKISENYSIFAEYVLLNRIIFCKILKFRNYDSGIAGQDGHSHTA